MSLSDSTHPQHPRTPGPATGAALQATVAAAITAVEGAAARIRLAEDAALSLAQRERLSEVAADLETACVELRPRLDPQARCLLSESRGWRSRLSSRLRRAPAETAAAPWSDALADAVAVLDEAVVRMTALGSGGSEPAEAAVLARDVARRLRVHRDALRAGVDRWSLAA